MTIIPLSSPIKTLILNPSPTSTPPPPQPPATTPYTLPFTQNPYTCSLLLHKIPPLAGKINLSNTPNVKTLTVIFQHQIQTKTLAALNSRSLKTAGDDFSEDDVFWTGDFAEQKLQSPDPARGTYRNGDSQSFRHLDKSGILAALPEDNGRKPNRSFMNRRNPTILSPATPNSSSSRLIPSIPRPNKSDKDLSQSMPVKFRQSVPVNVPIFTRKSRNGGELADVDIGEDDEEEMLPPHEIVARG